VGAQHQDKTGDVTEAAHRAHAAEAARTAHAAETSPPAPAPVLLQHKVKSVRLLVSARKPQPEEKESSEDLPMAVDEEPEVSATSTPSGYILTHETILRVVGGQGLPRELPLRESRRGRLRHCVGVRSAAISHGSILNLPNKVQEGAARIRIPSSRAQAERPSLRYVTALSNNLELTSDGSALGASRLVRFALFCQMARASNANPTSRGAV
jgi:hypothetical protein